MEEEDPNPQYAQDKRKPIFRRDRHLQSALHKGEIKYLLDNWSNPAGLKREHHHLKRDTRGCEFLSSADYIHWALLFVSKTGPQGSSDRELSHHIRVANQATQLGAQDYSGVVVVGPSTNPPSLIRQVFSIKKRLSLIVRKITFSEDYLAEYNFFGCKGKCYGNLHVVWPSDKFAYIITHSHFLAVRDCINAWFSALAYGLVAPRKYPMYNLYNEIANVIYAVLHDISIYKDDTYDILKSWQPLVIATILKDIEGEPHFLDSLYETRQKYKDSMLVRLATRTVASTIDVHVALELTGLTKCFGHPEIEMDESVAAWIEKGSVLKPGLSEVAEEIRSAFVLEFSRNYYKQRRRWPNLIMMDGHDPYVRQCYEGGYWGERPNEPWTPGMFRNIQFGKTLEFDYQVYTADLLADKAIIPGLDHWPYEYDAQSHRTMYGRFPTRPPRQSNNVIMQYVSREEVNVREIIEKVSTGTISSQWKVTVAVAKEREMKKKKARFFGKLTLEMWLYQVATENNIKQVFKFILHQTMTKTEDDLFKHLLKISETSSTDEGGAVFISMDFSSWCTSFRCEGVTPLFEELDRLLGVKNVMSYTQRFPLESILLFQDRFHSPQQGPDGNPLNGPRCIHGPEAWMEGLRQKGWTLATIMLILIASWRCGTIATLTGQGDNQVIYLRLPSAATLEGLRMTRPKYIAWFQETLRDLCTQAGITLKLEETWVSSSLLEYGREFFFKGAQVSSALKRISRIASEANQTIPSFNGDIAGIYSAGMGAAQKDHQPIAPFWCTILEGSISALDRHPKLRSRSSEYMSSLLSVPRVLGGWPITIFANFCTRAVQDPLTSAMHLVRTFTKSPRHREHILRIATTKTKKANPAMLIKDPQSLPLFMPRQPENYLKNKIAEGLPILIKNKELRPLFDPEVEAQKTNLIEDLMAIRPCNPKLMSKIMTLSNVGKQDALISKFSSTRSIQNVACREWSSEVEVLRDVASMEESMLDHILSRGIDSTLAAMDTGTCITNLAQEIRERGWGLQLEGITMPAQQEQTQICEWSKVPLHMYGRAISLTAEGDPATCWSLARGPVPPYIGAPTRVRAKRQPLQEMETYSFTQALSQALQLRSWVKGDEGLTSLLDTIIREKTDATEEELDRRTSHVYSGSLTHRLPCPTMSRGGQSNTTSNFASHIRITSSTATEYAKKGEDYTICFQSVFLYGIASLNILYHKYGSIPERMALVITRGCCTWTIPPETFTLGESLYKGVHIPTAVMHIDPLENPHLPYNPKLCSIEESYSAHLGYKFAVWVLNRRDMTHISILQHRALDDTSTPPFVNLSEMCRLNLDNFRKVFICFLLLMDTQFSTCPSSILAELRISVSRTGFDDLIDSIVLSGLTHSFCRLTRASPLDMQTREGWRSAMSDAISLFLYKGVLRIVNEFTIILPENTKHTFTRWYRVMAHYLKRRIEHDFFDRLAPHELIDLLEDALPTSPLSSLRWPPLALSEEESVAGIRRIGRPTRRNIRCIPFPTHSCPIHLRMEDAEIQLEEAMHCVAGGRTVNQIYEIMFYLAPVIGNHYQGKIHLYTHGDTNGMIYSIICHTLGSSVESGIPRWDMTRLSARTSLETGPGCVTGDPCNVPYDHNGFLANIGNHGPTRREAGVNILELWVTNGNPMAHMAYNSHGLSLTNDQAPLPRPWRLWHTYIFQKVRGHSQDTWRLWVNRDLDARETITTIGLGNISPSQSLNRPMECVTVALAQGTPCFNILSSLYHLIQGTPTTRSHAVQLITKGLARCLGLFPSLMTAGEGLGFLEPLIDKDVEVRKDLVDKIAVFGLLAGLLNSNDVRYADQESSYIRFHVHYMRSIPSRICQERCKLERDRIQVFRRKYKYAPLKKWWKPCVLLVASLAGDGGGRMGVRIQACIKMKSEH